MNNASDDLFTKSRKVVLLVPKICFCLIVMSFPAKAEFLEFCVWKDNQIRPKFTRRVSLMTTCTLAIKDYNLCFPDVLCFFLLAP